MIEENDELDPDILQLLGSDPTQDKTFGENLHKDLAMRWKHILTNGIPKEEKANLLKEYLPAENCIPMKAPVLNPELKSALSDTSLKKDSYSEQKQNQMSSCISAIGKALNLALTQVENTPQEIIKTLSDAGRLLCDTHYRESLSRRFTIVNSISKQKREIIKNTKIDEYLFGSNLSEHLKTSKVISTSASELRFSTQISNRSSQYRSQPRTTRQGALNGRGAPRTTYAEPRVYPGQSRHSVPLQPAPPLQPPPPPARGPRDRRTALPPPTQRSRSYPQQTRRR
ncbi:bromodomain-containing protein 4-like [Achroia grisella]|uniref:bromodomain-containing protein 4-like n=1 Tax=Achroia grisella TaxID=688607 RepID=UPI0027D303C1|nr:bromodomain-containing protein 4-like [Achroia grisella]